MRRLATAAVVAVVTVVGGLWWLHHGDLSAAMDQTVEPVVAQWDADLLARDAGFADDALPSTDPAPAQ